MYFVHDAHLAELLLAHGAQLNIRDLHELHELPDFPASHPYARHLSTPLLSLMHRKEKNRLGIMRVFLDHGADPCLADARGTGKDPESPCVQKDDMAKIYPAYREADIVILASPMYYWSFSSQLKAAFDRLFAVAECNPNYANPKKDCALIMAAEGDFPENWKPVLDYYHSLTGFLEWKDLGQVLAVSWRPVP